MKYELKQLPQHHIQMLYLWLSVLTYSGAGRQVSPHNTQSTVEGGCNTMCQRAQWYYLDMCPQNRLGRSEKSDLRQAKRRSLGCPKFTTLLQGQLLLAAHLWPTLFPHPGMPSPSPPQSSALAKADWHELTQRLQIWLPEVCAPPCAVLITFPVVQSTL